MILQAVGANVVGLALAIIGAGATVAYLVLASQTTRKESAMSTKPPLTPADRAHKLYPVALCIILAVIVGVFWHVAHAASITRPCKATTAEPSLDVILPNGAHISAARVDYDLDGRTVRITGEVPQQFCDGYEDIDA